MAERIYSMVPNAAFFKTVQQYAFWMGKRHFTHDDAISNFINYINYAKRNN